MSVLMGESISGLLPIKKPLGMVSKDVSRWLTKRVGPLKMGHAGTLDPEASGVLPVLLGTATRLQDYLMEMPKIYEFEVEFGYETTTLDKEGEVINRGPVDHLTESTIREALGLFRGPISQVPPIYSAVKYQGKPLYQYARKSSSKISSQIPSNSPGKGALDDGIIESLRRTVEVYEYSLLRWQVPRGLFRVHCSKGTYVRCLARDLARSLGTFGNVTQLNRTEASGVSLDQSFSLEEIDHKCRGMHSDFTKDSQEYYRIALSNFILPLSGLKLGIARWVTPNQDLIKRLIQGQEIFLEWDRFKEDVKPSCHHFHSAPRSANGQEAEIVSEGERVKKCFEGITPVIVLTDHGRTIGIAHATAHYGGQVILKLKRGL